MSLQQWILVNGDTVQFVLFFALLFAFAGLEWLAPRRPGPMSRTTRWTAVGPAEVRQ